MKRDYPDRPFVGVGVVIFKHGSVLLVQRAKPPRSDNWSIPGGAQELGETVRETAHREILEETGLEVEILGLIDVVDGITRDEAAQVQFHYTLVDFAAEWVAGEARADADVAAVRWVALDHLGEVPMWGQTHRIIGEGIALRGRK